VIQEPTAVERWAPVAGLSAIFGLTLIGLALGLAGVEIEFEDEGMRLVTYGVFVVVAIAEFIITRYVVLPARASEPGMTREVLAVLGYAFSCTAAIFSIGGALVTGSGWLALPLGVVALVAWITIWSYLRDLPLPTSTTAN